MVKTSQHYSQPCTEERMHIKIEQNMKLVAATQNAYQSNFQWIGRLW